MKLIAVNPTDPIFGGTINPPITTIPSDPQQALGKLLGLGINLFILVCALFLLIYMLWGAYDWIASSGEKEKLAKAQQKITNAALGMIVVIVVLTVFSVITGQILGIFEITPNGWKFSIPHL